MQKLSYHFCQPVHLPLITFAKVSNAKLRERGNIFLEFIGDWLRSMREGENLIKTQILLNDVKQTSKRHWLQNIRGYNSSPTDVCVMTTMLYWYQQGANITHRTNND